MKFSAAHDTLDYSTFALPSFAELNADVYAAYIELRIRGYPEEHSFCIAFPAEFTDRDQFRHHRVRCVEFNPYTVAKLNERLIEVRSATLWNEKISLHELLSLVRDKSILGATRLQAMKELNVMCDITITDENGKTRKGRKLEDFYNDNPQPETETEE